ncbi:MAG: TRAP transporter substrate-binding protein [Azospirillaceae bacterium]
MRKFASSIGGICLAGAVALTGAAPASAQDTVTLRVGNWLPMHHLIVKDILEPWAQAITEETGGTLQFDIMTSALGPPPTYFDLVLDGAVDIGYGVSGHNPGRFTMTQVMDLPFMSPDPWAGAMASWMTYERYGDQYGEHDGAEVLGLFVHGEPYIHMAGPAIERISELEGVKIRVGGNVTGRMISALGGVPVQLPPTEAQQAMSRGVADGITFPLESIPFFGITPVIENSTRIPGGIYTDTFWIAINEDTWNGLSEDHQAAIRRHSGVALALLAGHAWSQADMQGEALMREAGINFVTLPDEDVETIRDTLQVLYEEWLAEAESRGLPGEEILAYAQAMVDAYTAAPAPVE